MNVRPRVFLLSPGNKEFLVFMYMFIISAVGLVSTFDLISVAN